MPDRPLMGLVSNSDSGMPTFPPAHTSEVDLGGMLSNSAETLEAATSQTTTTNLSSLSSSCFESKTSVAASGQQRLFSSGQMTSAVNSREISATAAQIGQHRLIKNGAGIFFSNNHAIHFLFIGKHRTHMIYYVILG